MTDRKYSKHYGLGTPCSNCGVEIGPNVPEDTEYCAKHREEAEEAVPIRELEALIAEWREHKDSAYQNTKLTPALELQELVEAHRDE